MKALERRVDALGYELGAHTAALRNPLMGMPAPPPGSESTCDDGGYCAYW